MQLTNEHIDYIIKDISYRGIVYEDLGDELVDHICTLVEERMAEGEKFIDAYDAILAQFGQEQDIQKLQSQTIQLTNNNTKIMLRNYLKIAIRNLSNHKFYSLINISGLAISMACCLLIALFVIDEISYDSFFKDSDQIYRTNRHGKYGDNVFDFAVSPAPLGPALTAEIPEIEYAVRFRKRGDFLVRTQNMSESYKETALVFTDPDFFKLFGVPLINGNPDEALKAKNTIAISEKIAEKYFPGKDAVGQVLVLDGTEEYQVTAVYENIPDNSTLHFDFLMSMENISRSKSTMWLSNNFYTYFKVRPGVDPKELERKINDMADAHVGPQVESFTGTNMKDFKSSGNYLYITLQPLRDVYLYSDFRFDINKTGDVTYVYLFIIIAVFILVIACINFMNLSTARSANRAKEVGVRKVLGSFKSHLIKQFLTESILISLAAFLISIWLVMLTLPFFNEIANKSLEIPFGSISFYLVLLGGALFVGFLAGVYPAFFLSSFKPADVLKGKLALGSKSGLIRSGLVIFQFFISIVLLIGTMAVYKQLKFIQNKKLGFDKEQVLIINDAYMLDDQVETFKKEVNKISNVNSATVSGYLPVAGYNRSDQTFWQEGKEPTDDNLVSMQFWSVDYDYLKTLGIELLEGRTFNKDIASDSNAILINEKAYAAYQLKNGEDSWIQTFDMDPNTNAIIPNQFIKYHVIGVIKDFNYESMKQPIGNLGLRIGRSTSVVSLRLNTNDFQSTIAMVKDVWEKFAPGLPFSYSFLDSAFDDMYRNEQRLAKVFTIFAGLAILIGCLGLFALAAFMAEQRTKEIGIRKVMGASVKSIVFMLSKEFSKLIIISFALAVPLAWWGIRQWLGRYSYKIDIGVEVYLLAGAIALLIAWFTISYQSIKAAMNNPVKSLRSE